MSVAPTGIHRSRQTRGLAPWVGVLGGLLAASLFVGAACESEPTSEASVGLVVAQADAVPDATVSGEGGYVVVPAHTELWASADRDSRTPLEGSEESVSTGSAPVVMKVVGRTGDILAVESASGACGEALPGLEGMRLLLHVSIADVQPITCADSTAADPLHLEIELAESGYVVRHAKSVDPIRVALVDPQAPLHDYSRFDYAALERLAAGLKREHPRETSVHVIADAEVPVQVLVSTADALAGAACERDTTTLWNTGGVPRECNFWRLTLEVRA